MNKKNSYSHNQKECALGEEMGWASTAYHNCKLSLKRTAVQ
ncbi:hypothetical protein ACFL5S_02115 [Fibrobacterota bacterium]